jgi:Rrf2 family protein
MKKSTKFSDALHILLHMAGSPTAMTSEMLSKSVRSNPVFVRSTMAGLRKSGFVKSEKGHGGGWKLSRDLKSITLFDLYQAVGSPTLLAIGNRSVSGKCQVEQAVHLSTNGAFQEAESMLITRFHETTLADLYEIIGKKSRHFDHAEKM